MQYLICVHSRVEPSLYEDQISQSTLFYVVDVNFANNKTFYSLIIHLNRPTDLVLMLNAK